MSKDPPTASELPAPPSAPPAVRDVGSSDMIEVERVVRLHSLPLRQVPPLSAFAPIPSAEEVHTVRPTEDNGSRPGNASLATECVSQPSRSPLPPPPPPSAPMDFVEVPNEISPQPSLGLDIHTPQTTDLMASSTGDTFPTFSGDQASTDGPADITQTKTSGLTTAESDASDKSSATHMTDVSLATRENGTAGPHHARSASDKPESRRLSRTPPPPRKHSSTSPALTDEEVQRINKSVLETVRLNYSGMRPSHSSMSSPSSTGPSGGSSRGGMHTMSSVPWSAGGVGAPAVAGVLVGRPRPETESPQTRLGSRLLPRTSLQSSDGDDYCVPARRYHSHYGPMSSAGSFLPGRSPPRTRQEEHGAHTGSAAAAPRLSLAKLGRERGSSEERTGDEAYVHDHHVEEASDVEVSELFRGSGLMSAVVLDGTDPHAEQRCPTTTLPSRSPVSILCKSSSLVGSSATSMPELHLSGTVPPDNTETMEMSDAASPVSTLLVGDPNRSWSTRRSRRGSRLGKLPAVRDTPRAVGFVSDELPEVEANSEAQHETSKQRILERMRHRRSSSVPEEQT